MSLGLGDAVPGDQVVVEFVAQAGGGGRDDEAVLPDDRRLEDFPVELREGFDAFLDQEVGGAHVHLDRRGGGEGAAPYVGRDMRVVGLGQGGDLPALRGAGRSGRR